MALPASARLLVAMMRGPGNPMQELLRREMGIDAFALDGDATELLEGWQDRPRQRIVLAY